MIYRSNLRAPDIEKYFKHLHIRRMPHAFGHYVMSDWDDKPNDDPIFGQFKQCGFMTHDEAAILAACAAQFHGKTAVDIGCHTGFTSKVINWMTNAPVECIDPMLANKEFRTRFLENTGFPEGGWCCGYTSDEYFRICPPVNPSLVCIDGDHNPGFPLCDAQNSARYLAEDGAIVLHDGIGWPVQEAVAWLMDNGFQARLYTTPHVLFVCWRGAFVPPDHMPDPYIVQQNLPARMPQFSDYFARLR